MLHGGSTRALSANAAMHTAAAALRVHGARNDKSNAIRMEHMARGPRASGWVRSVLCGGSISCRTYKTAGQGHCKNLFARENQQKGLLSKPLGGKVLADLRHFLTEGIGMELASRIKEQRALLELSQEDLAERIFVSRQTISNWETDKTYPDVQSLLLLSNLFGVSIDSLVKGDVEEMKAVLSDQAKKMNNLSVVMLVSAGLTLAWVFATAIMDMVGLVRFDMLFMVLPAAAMFVPALVAAAMIEKIKHDNKLFTYGVIKDFMDGKTPDVDSLSNQRAGKMWVLKRVVFTVLVAFGLLFCLGPDERDRASFHVVTKRWW